MSYQKYRARLFKQQSEYKELLKHLLKRYPEYQKFRPRTAESRMQILKELTLCPNKITVSMTIPCSIKTVEIAIKDIREFLSKPPKAEIDIANAEPYINPAAYVCPLECSFLVVKPYSMR